MPSNGNFQQSASPVSIIKPSFTAGEFAPAIHVRVDLEKYTEGAKLLKNFIVHPQGGASNRPGTHYIATAKIAGKTVRLLPFEFSTSQKYVIEAGDLYFRFFTNGGQIIRPFVDPIDSYTKLLLHMNTNYTDSASGGKTVTASGDAAISTAWYKFGTGSSFFDGTGDYLSSADHADWDFSGGIWTVDHWVYPTTLGASRALWEQSTDANNKISAWVTTAGAVAFSIVAASVTTVSMQTPDGVVAVNGAYHIEVSENGNNYYIFVNGALLATVSSANRAVNYTGTLLIAQATGVSNFFGYFDEFRISNGIARHTATFIPPTEEYGYIPLWATATGYIVGNYIITNGVMYICVAVHTSGTFATDLASTYWVVQQVYEVVSPYTEPQVAAMQYVQSADVLFTVHGSVKPKQLNRLGNANWTVTDYNYQGGPFMVGNTSATTIAASATTGSVTLTATTAVFNSQHISSLWKLRHYIEGQTSSVSVTATGVQTGIKCGGTWRIITHGTWTAKFNVERSIDNGVSWQVIRLFSSVNDNNVSTFQTDDNDGDPYLVRINCTSYTSGTIQIDLTTDPFTQEGWAQVTAFTNTTHVTATVTRTIGLTTAITDWAEGSWSDYRGWPAAVTFTQDRLSFGGTRSEPQTHWETETSNYYSFRRHSPLLATDGISKPLPARQLNAISWIIPMGVLVAGTSSTIWTISAADKILTPTSAVQIPTDYSGASPVLPIIIGNRAIYVQSGGAVVRDLAFSFPDDGYISTNISVLSKHLFENKSITAIAYQQSPGNLVWCIRSDGALLSMTYLREQNVLAWTQHDTNGSFESLCSLKGSGTHDEIWFSVQRGTNRYIERMADRLASTNTADQFFLDCGITYDGPPAGVITGLSHLEGRAVGVLADGNVIYDSENTITVISGQITLPNAYSKIHVGIPYNADLETLNVELPTGSGTAQGKKVKISKLTLMLENSSGGKIGPSFDALHEIGGIFSRVYSKPLSLATGPVHEPLGAGYEDGGRICIRQTKPLPISVLAVIPTVTVGGMSLLDQ